eukprot:3315362-Rhodomonas_salina.7
MVLPGTRARYVEEAQEGRRMPAMLLRARYAVSGTDILYGTISLGVCYAVSGTGPCLAARDVWVLRMYGPMLGYAATRPATFMLLRMSGADRGYGATRQPPSSEPLLPKAQHVTSVRSRAVLSSYQPHTRSTYPIVLPASYAMSATGVAYGVICLRACYATACTDMVYAATPDQEEH